MDCVSKMYEISKVVNDDLHAIAFIIQSFDVSTPVFNRILWDLQHLRVDKYNEALDIALSQTPHVLIEISKGLTFKTLKGYNEYLMSLLKLNNLPFSPYIQHIQTRSTSYNKVVVIHESLSQ